MSSGKFYVSAVLCCVWQFWGVNLASADSLRLPEESKTVPLQVQPGPESTTIIIPEVITKVPDTPETTLTDEKKLVIEEGSSPSDSEKTSIPHPETPATPEQKFPIPDSENQHTPKKSDVGRSIEDILADPMQNLSIPKDTDKLDFLEGKWRCETDLINLETNEPIVMEFVFDKAGKGNGRIREKAGRVFTGSASAKLQGGVLRIKVGKLVTPGSSASYNGSEIRCQQKGGIAVCSGKNSGQPPISWQDATFHRVK